MNTRIGTLCIIDRQPRHFSEADYESLRDLAAMVEDELSAIQLATLDELTGLSIDAASFNWPSTALAAANAVVSRLA